MSLYYPWPYDAYIFNPYNYDIHTGIHQGPIESYLDRYWTVNSLDTPVGDLRGSCEKENERFHAHIDVKQFKPEEISVKVEDESRTITIEGKHEEKLDQHGSISRHFVRKHILPEDYDIAKLQSQLSSDGVLTITAPKASGEKQIKYKEIPIKKIGSLEAERKRGVSKIKNNCHIL